MGSKPVVATLTSGAINPSTLNSNFDILAEAIADSVDRAGDSDTNNQMSGDLDMGGFSIRNVGDPTLDGDLVTRRYLENSTDQGATAGNLVTALDALADAEALLVDVEATVASIDDLYIVSATEPSPVQPSGGIWFNSTNSVISYSNGSSYATGASDAITVGGFTPSQSAVANGIAVRNADGDLAGDILGNAATATSATSATTATTATTLSTATGSAPVYGCRAWVSFNGGSAGTFAGGTSTVSRSAGSTTATVTTTNNHGLVTGHYVFAATGVAAGLYVVTVTGLKTFTITTVATTLLSSASITFSVRTIMGSGNVSSVAYATTGVYVVNFTTAMPDANYVITGACKDVDTVVSQPLIGTPGPGSPYEIFTAISFAVMCSYGSGVYNSPNIGLSVIR